MPAQSSLTHCPHCGKSLTKHNMFQSSQPIEVYDSDSASVFAEAINFAARFAVISGGSLLVLWALDWPIYWAAPLVGMGSTIALVVMEIKNRPAKPEPKPHKTRLEINVTERPGAGRCRTVIDVFEGCRPMQLWKLADAHLNQGAAITRREMMRRGVSQGQFELIRDRLLAGGWADLSGDYDTAPAVLNWKGRAILRGVLVDFPTPPVYG